MGLSSTTNRVSYSGDGSSTIFSFPYYFFNPQDLDVYAFDTGSSIIYPQVLNTNYTVGGTVNQQGVYPAGGTVILASALATNLSLIIVRSPNPVQNFAQQQNSPVNSLALVQQFDYLTALVQRLQDDVNKCIQLPDGLGFVTGNVQFSSVLPQAIALPGVSGGAPLCVNSGANGWALGLVATGQSGAIAYAGTLPVTYGGTGQNQPLTQYGVMYGASTMAMGETPAGPTGYVLTGQGSSAPPVWLQPNIGSGSFIAGVLQVSAGGTGNSSFGQAFQLYGMNSAGTGFEYKNIFVNSAGTMTVQAGQQIILPSGTTSLPGISFSASPGTGFSISASTVVFSQNSNAGIQMVVCSGGQVNFGYNTVAGTTNANPFTAQGNFNGVGLFQYGNASVSPNSVTAFQIMNGVFSGNNATEIGNAANLSSGYFSGGSYVSATAFQSALFLLSENATSGYIGFNVGGRLLTHQRAVLSASSFLLTGGVNLVMTASSSGNIFTQTISGSSASYGIVWPSSQGGANTVPINNGSGGLTWGSLAASVANLNVVTITTSNYVVGSSTQLVISNSGICNIQLFNPSGNSGFVFKAIKADPGAGIVTVTCSNALFAGPIVSPTMTSQYQEMEFVSDGTSWQSTNYNYQPAGMRWTAASSVISGSFAAVSWRTLDYDTLGLMAGSSGIITVNRAGRWQISACIQHTQTAVAGDNVAIGIYKNGNQVNVMTNELATGQAIATVLINDTQNLNLNDQITIRTLNANTAPGLQPGSTFSWVSMSYLGQ
jgi:hypothetical protein